MGRAGLTVHKQSEVEKVTKDPDTGKLSLHKKDGEVHGDFEAILMAVGGWAKLLGLLIVYIVQRKV